MSTPTKTAIVVGGSLAGLMTALVLRSAGHTVRVLERNSPDVLQSQAAGIRAGPELHAFLEKYVKDLDADYCTTATWFEIVKTNGDLEMKIPTPDPLRLTTWKMVYDMLKKALLADEGAKYETGKKVEDVKYAGEKVTVIVRDLGSGETKTIEADLVIGADGAHSNLRRIVMEDAEAPKYAGYVTWRGRVAEGDLSEETRTALKGRCVTMRAEGGYMISYYVPSDAGDDNKQREFVWIWYDTIPEDSSGFTETFTDVDGKRHLTTIPRGKIAPKVWQRVSSRGTKTGNPQFSELISSITEPLVSAIRDFPGSKSVFCDGKVLLVGDAFSLCRPHTGGSTSQAAFQALELIKVLDGTLALEQWEKVCVESAAAERARSLGAAGFFFGGEMPKFVKDMMAQGQT